MKNWAQKIELLEEQKRAIAQKQRELRAKQADYERRRRTRAKIIIGGLIVGAARQDEELLRYLRAIIAEKITGPELALIAEIYPELATASATKTTA